MKQTSKTVYIITNGIKEQEIEEQDKAVEIKDFLEEFFNTPFVMTSKQKSVYEIEKGDKVHWVHDGKINENRTDVVIDIVKDMWGDIKYLTQELNGSKIGSAYRKDLTIIL